LGVCLPPLLMLFVFTMMPLLLNKASPRVTGHIAIIDRTGKVADRFAELYAPDEIAKRQEKRKKAIEGMFDSSTAKLDLPVDEKSKEMMKSQASAFNVTLDVTVVKLPADADVETEKAPIAAAEGREKLEDGDKRLALIVIDDGSLTPDKASSGDPDDPYKPYHMYLAPKLDFEVRGDIERQIGKSIVDARLLAAGIQANNVRELMTSPRNEAEAVTKQGSRQAANELSGMFIPMGFMFLIWIGVFSAGQYLLSSTIEEKSNRVMEVLLSAVSPLQLMTGKIIGQMAVGLSILLAYGTLGGGALIAFKYGHLIDPKVIILSIVYFFIAFGLIASLMAAIGSAVSSVQEAQSLIGPVMIVLIIPMLLWMPISRNPNSPFAVVCGLLPPISPFVMVLRIAGAEKIPDWQVVASLVIGIGSVFAAIWCAAKVFRVGALMYGKPPSLMGLMKWLRYS
ncbi:MAG TPA: ABC transporter permease, partial [Phycisphaerales bacterium]|nr:ABC transporter permease [Phycisphaerales bacterium]